MPSRKSFRFEQLGLGWDAPGLVAGVDEAGRGPLAGPVVAAAVILDELKPIRGLADSKVLTAATRERLYDLIRARALCCAVGSASVEEIDDINILQATMLAMRRAVEGLRLPPHRVVVDGNRVPVLKMPVAAVVKGDALVKAISAASILAKVERDRLCHSLHDTHPHYGFVAHKGYGTPEHLAALQRHGPCVAHRRSFAPVRLAAEGVCMTVIEAVAHPAQHRRRRVTQPAAEPQCITSRDNPLLIRVRKLAQDGSAYRKLGQTWIEGDHLGAALGARGGSAAVALLSDTAWCRPELRQLAQLAPKVMVLPDALFKGISTLDTPAAIGFVIDVPPAPAIDPHASSIVLDRVQDAGNVGSMLRSAAAFGLAQVLALKGTAALWSPKVLRAGMGAHFGLRLIEGLDDEALAALQLPLVATSSHAGSLLPDAQLPQRPAPGCWAMKGRSVGAALLARCALQVRIPQPGGEESLNVAAAAAVCLYESARRASARGRS